MNSAIVDAYELFRTALSNLRIGFRLGALAA
jgi:hypothetical protein